VIGRIPDGFSKALYQNRLYQYQSFYKTLLYQKLNLFGVYGNIIYRLILNQYLTITIKYGTTAGYCIKLRITFLLAYRSSGHQLSVYSKARQKRKDNNNENTGYNITSLKNLFHLRSFLLKNSSPEISIKNTVNNELKTTRLSVYCISVKLKTSKLRRKNGGTK